MTIGWYRLWWGPTPMITHESHRSNPTFMSTPIKHLRISLGIFAHWLTSPMNTFVTCNGEHLVNSNRLLPIDGVIFCVLFVRWLIKRLNLRLLDCNSHLGSIQRWNAIATIWTFLTHVNRRLWKCGWVGYTVSNVHEWAFFQVYDYSGVRCGRSVFYLFLYAKYTRGS